jgi:hypothetical protein
MIPQARPLGQQKYRNRDIPGVGPSRDFESSRTCYVSTCDPGAIQCRVVLSSPDAQRRSRQAWQWSFLMKGDRQVRRSTPVGCRVPDLCWRGHAQSTAGRTCLRKRKHGTPTCHPCGGRGQPTWGGKNTGFRDYHECLEHPLPAREPATRGGLETRPCWRTLVRRMTHSHRSGIACESARRSYLRAACLVRLWLMISSASLAGTWA